jgi:hypothetical protein
MKFENLFLTSYFYLIFTSRYNSIEIEKMQGAKV